LTHFFITTTKRFFTILALIFLIGCVSDGTTTRITSNQASPSPTIAEAQAVSYNGPKARIAVSQFKDKTGAGSGWWNRQIGDGMADQLTTALFNSNRFIVLERQTLGDVLQEQDLGASGRVRQDTAAPIGKIEGAELLVVGAVTEFQGAASGGGGGIGGIGGVGGIGGNVLGALAGGVKQAHMAIDLRIIDAKTSRVLAATSVEGTATDVNLGGMLGGYGTGGALVGGLGGWKNTPTEKALRICIQKAVEFVASQTPPVYYRYGN
jgi:curli biogenesis system outer membrane secretion channel CsgG